MTNPIVCITGATSGIGEACAFAFAQKGYNLILVGRRQQRLETLAQTLQNEYKSNCYIMTLDVKDADTVKKQFETLPEAWQKINILINNAGLAAGRDPFDKAAISDWENMIDTNIKGLLYVSKAVIPYMQLHKIGHIINIGSTAAKEVYENGNVYCATKSAVEAISKSQRIDLLPYSIKVTCVHPGAVDTEFSIVRFKGDTEKAKKVYEGYTPLNASDVANTIIYVASLPKHVCINDITMTCTQQANSFYLNKSL
jgi:3-hydroxy acid dehydrogenase / malonic semialdehyde reductase